MSFQGDRLFQRSDQGRSWLCPRLHRAGRHLRNAYQLRRTRSTGNISEGQSGCPAGAWHLEPNLAEAHASRGYLYAAYEWDLAAAEREFVLASDLNPGDVTPRHWLASTLTIVGRWEEALDAIEAARRIDPLSLIVGAKAGLNLYLMQRYQDAEDELLKTIELEPNYYLAHLFLARVFVMQGRTVEALHEFEEALSFLSDNACDPSRAGSRLLRRRAEKQGEGVVISIAAQEGSRVTCPPTSLQWSMPGWETSIGPSLIWRKRTRSGPRVCTGSGASRGLTVYGMIRGTRTCCNGSALPVAVM